VHFVFTTLGYHPDQTGGAFRYATEIAEGLAALGHTVHVIYPSMETGSPREVQERRNGVHLHRFSVRRMAFFKNWLASPSIFRPAHGIFQELA
jgi:hypothetical protein